MEGWEKERGSWGEASTAASEDVVGFRGCIPKPMASNGRRTAPPCPPLVLLCLFTHSGPPLGSLSPPLPHVWISQEVASEGEGSLVSQPLGGRQQAQLLLLSSCPGLPQGLALAGCPPVRHSPAVAQWGCPVILAPCQALFWPQGLCQAQACGILAFPAGSGCSQILWCPILNGDT